MTRDVLDVMIAIGVPEAQAAPSHTLSHTQNIKMPHYTPSPTLSHTKNISVSETVQIEGGAHLKINTRKKNDDDFHHVHIKHEEQTYMSTSRNIHKSLTQLKRLSGLVDTDEPNSSFELDPWMENPDVTRLVDTDEPNSSFELDPWMENPDVTRVKRLQKKSEKARNSALEEYRNALSAFKSTHERQALAEYTLLKRRFPLHYEYVQILEKLQAIFALPDMLDAYIQRPTVMTAQDITDNCRSILCGHERRQYDPLFQTSTYLDLLGIPKQPKYGKWTCNAKEYEMEKMIQDIQNKIS